jgi:hypothetical protein
MSWWDDWLKNRIQGEINDLIKSDEPSAPGTIASTQSGSNLPDQPEMHHDASEQIGRKGIIDDPYFDFTSQQVLYKNRMSRLTNRTLKDVSLRDWLVSTILQCRVDTLLRFSRPEHKKFEMGFRVIKRNDKEEYTQEDDDNIAMLEDFIYHCGRKDGTPQDEVMLFGEFLKLIGRDALTFGHTAIEKVKTRAGGLHRFRPLPAESVYRINKKLSRDFLERELATQMKAYTQNLGDNDPRREQLINEVPIDYYKYVQVSYDQRPMGIFGDEDMIFHLFNPQNFADSNGYCYSPLELCIINVTNHMNVENYNANFFTHGYAARGILHLKGTVTQSNLANFRRQFYNTISGQQHAWRTPIVAGLDEVQWVPMSASAREMEYINFNNHLLRIICSQFQIDPIELGLDYLISGNGRAPSQQANNEYKIAYSRERGLYPLLMYVEDLINGNIIPSLDRDLAQKYKFVFTGYTDETAQTEIAQMQAEMTVWKTMNDLLTQSQRPKLNEPIADLPLNQAFWALVEKNYTRGEIREKFLGDKGASKRKELQYIPGDPAFLNWQQNILAIQNAAEQKAQAAQAQAAQAAQAQAEAQSKQMQDKHAEAKHSREEEKHKMEMEQAKANAAANAARQPSLQDIAHEFGATKASNVGGKVIANPINKLED